MSIEMSGFNEEYTLKGNRGLAELELVTVTYYIKIKPCL